MKKQLLAALLAPYFLAAAEVSLANFLTDPGFEKPHADTPQINAKGVKEVNGWSALPNPANAWTSVGYVDKGGLTIGNKRPAIEPAEGNSYLRMFSFKSSSWLALRSPSFPLTKGNIYSIAFSVAPDLTAPMAKLTVSLEADGKSYNAIVYDLIRIEAGWNTVAYRVTYNGPERSGRLVIRAEREESATGGSLNLDHFRPWTPGEAEFALAPRGAKIAERPEIGGFRVELPSTGEGAPLLPGKARRFKLNASPGRYRLMVKAKSSDRSGNEGDSMYGGYTYWMPRMLYRFTLDGKPLAPEISARMVQPSGRDEKGNGLYSGWLGFPEPVEVKAGSELAVECGRDGGVIHQIVLLNETEWKAEKLRLSNLFTTPPGRGFGNAWASTPWRPTLYYPLASLETLLRSLERFERHALPLDTTRFRQEGAALGEKVKAFLDRKNVAAPETIKEGVELTALWESYREKLRTECRRTLAKILKERLAETGSTAKAANLSCHPGRETEFNAVTAGKYFAAALRRLEGKDASEARDFLSAHLFLTDVDNGLHYLAKAKEFAAEDQKTVEFPQFFVAAKTQPAAPLGGSESLLLNGVWQFAAGKPDALPAKWLPVAIPNDSPFSFYNVARISEEKFNKSVGAYWDAAPIRDAWFRTRFRLPESWAGHPLYLHFNEITEYAEIFVNGRFAGYHYGGLIPFELDVTKFAVPGAENHLLILVSSSRKIGMGEVGKANRYHKLLGHYLYPMTEAHAYPLRIAGDVSITAKPRLRAEEIYVRTSVAKKSFTIRTTLVNDGDAPVKTALRQRVEGGPELPELPVSLAPGERKTVEQTASFPEPKLWGIGGEYGSPHHRYTLRSELGGSVEHTPFAFREATIAGRKVYLNGVELPIQGDSVTIMERVLFRNNKWAEMLMNRQRKEARINFIRYHRFNLQNWLVAACDDAGILSEGEGPWWGLWAPTDINGDNNILDPVWLENSRDYYVKTMRTFRNSPSMLFFSLENETMTSDNAEVFKLFRAWAQAEAPHMILMNHSHASAGNPDSPVAVLHDYDLGSRRVADYARNAEKPIVIGEFWNPEVSKALHDPLQARGAERLMTMWLKRSIQSYRKAGADGVMPYTFATLGGIASRRDATSCGPWGELYSETPRKVYSIPIPWPTQNGSGGMRVLRHDLDRMSAIYTLNFFDPSRPAATPGLVGDAYRDCFREMPLDPPLRSPELLVELTANGQPAAGVVVFSESKITNRRAIPTDAGGKAWFIFEQGGEYLISVEWQGKRFRERVKLEPTAMEAPGWEYLPRLRFDLQTGKAEFIPGKSVAPAATATTIAPKAESKAGLRPAKSSYEGRAAVGPDGYIRRWLVLGPFPNYGSRLNRQANDLDRDFLGGEAEFIPALDRSPVAVEFKKNPEAFWEPGRFELKWDWLVAENNKVDLTGAFLFDHPGLDGIIQYVLGYAACYIKSDRDCDAVLSIGSDDGHKIWLNGEMVARLQIYRASKPDENTYPVRLKKGWNRLLVKIEQETGGWEFYLRFLDNEGKPMLLETSLTPPFEAVPLKRGMAVRDWMLLGPFPNASERPAAHLDLPSSEPDGKTATAEFPVWEKAYYDQGKVELSWRRYQAPKELTDLGAALLRPEIPGLDVAPLQYVAAAAWTELEVPEAGEYQLEVSTFNPIRVYINGKPVLEDRGFTFNRDPNSPVLPPSFRKELKAKVTLPKGKSRLLVKSAVDYGPFDFTLKLN